MTREEWLVIAVAAAAFVIINIIMWTIIAFEEKRAKKRTAVPADIRNALSEAASGLVGSPSVPPSRSAVSDTRTISIQQLAENEPFAMKRRDDFTVTNSIILVSTNEVIE